MAVGGKPVGRTTGNLCEASVRLELELLGTRPDIHTVAGNVDGQVADDGDAPLICKVLEPVPLGEKQVLHRLPKTDFLCQLPADGLYRLRLPQSVGLRPVQPGTAAVLSLDGHEQGIIIQPEGVLPAKAVVILVGLCQKPVTGQAQDGIAADIKKTVVDVVRPFSPINGLIFPRLQQTLLRQIIKVDEIGVARIGGKGLIGGVPIACGANGQNLPAGLAALGKKLYKIAGCLSHCADAIGRGKGEDGQKDSGVSQGRTTFLR